MPPPPPGVYGGVTVAGDHVDEFYYVRQDHFLLLPGASDQERLAKAALLSAFGPHPVGAEVRVRTGSTYYFFAVCHSALSWATRRLQYISGSGAQQVSLTCPA